MACRRRTSWEAAVAAARASCACPTPEQTNHGDSGEHTRGAGSSGEGNDDGADEGNADGVDNAVDGGDDSATAMLAWADADGTASDCGAGTRGDKTRMQLFVRSTHGGEEVFDTDHDASVASLQKQIERRRGVPVQNQWLTHAGTTLTPGAQLGASGVRNEASVELLVSGRGGSSEGSLPDLSAAPPHVPADSAARAPPATAAGREAGGFSPFFVPLIAAAWGQTHGEGMLACIAAQRERRLGATRGTPPSGPCRTRA